MPARSAMSLDDYFDTLIRLWRDEIVICSLGTSSNEWWRRTESTSSFYVNAAMGFASSVALGVALNCPGERVWMLDSDGALAMNLGGLYTEASVLPDNYLHIVLNNRSYGCLGAAELVNAQHTDTAAIAVGAGLADATTATTRDALAAAIESARERHGFIVAEVAITADLDDFEPPLEVPLDGPEAKYLFGRQLSERLGRPVFGPNGF